MRSVVQASLLALALLCNPNKAVSTSTGQQSRSHSSAPYPSEAQQPYASYGHKPVTSILAVKSLYPQGSAASNDRIKDDFARLNKINKYGGTITRDSIHAAVVRTKRKRPSQDIVVMGVASWN